MHFKKNCSSGQNADILSKQKEIVSCCILLERYKKPHKKNIHCLRGNKLFYNSRIKIMIMDFEITKKDRRSVAVLRAGREKNRFMKGQKYNEIRKIGFVMLLQLKLNHYTPKVQQPERKLRWKRVANNFLLFFSVSISSFVLYIFFW